MSVSSLIEAVAKETVSEQAPDTQNQAEKIGHVVYKLFFNDVLELLGAERQCVLDAGVLPKASPVSRLLAPHNRMANLCHRTISMDDDMACFVLAHLDGTRNRDALCNLMVEAIRTDQVLMPNLKERNIDEIKVSMRDQLEAILQQLARCGVLI